MRLLITGYPGWLTNRFLETLRQFNHTISFIRCLSLGSVPPPVITSVPAESVQGNLLDPASLKEATKGIDVILHAAGVLHVKKISDFYRINRDGTRHLLEAASRNGVKKIIYISSNAAQGFCRGRGFELDESDPNRPQSHYGKSKYEGELEVLKFHHQGKIQSVILRPAMFYGPPIPVRHLNIFRQIQKGWFPIFGSGENLRSITYIDHLIQGVHLAIQKHEAEGNVYYITDEVIPTLKEIVLEIAQAMGVRVRLIHFPKWMAHGADWFDRIISSVNIYWMQPHILGEAHKSIACKIGKAKRELGYHPAVDFREGYRRTIAWCRDKRLLD